VGGGIIPLVRSNWLMSAVRLANLLLGLGEVFIQNDPRLQGMLGRNHPMVMITRSLNIVFIPFSLFLNFIRF
jgi:hypothetical protein